MCYYVECTDIIGLFELYYGNELESWYNSWMRMKYILLFIPHHRELLMVPSLNEKQTKQSKTKQNNSLQINGYIRHVLVDVNML